jgi:hypothetical protein
MRTILRSRLPPLDAISVDGKCQPGLVDDLHGLAQYGSHSLSVHWGPLRHGTQLFPCLDRFVKRDISKVRNLYRFPNGGRYFLVFTEKSMQQTQTHELVFGRHVRFDAHSIGNPQVRFKF